MGDGLPAFLITIDTEGDNLWSRPREITTANAAYLGRFQSLCERYGLRPTYVTNWEMANSKAFVEFGLDLLSRGMGEVGMHLHAWNSPPLEPLTDDDYSTLPYLMEYPERLIREKVRVLTDKLEEAFGAKMVSHRAGRWGFDGVYARVLREAGYRVDCSVTPGVSWRSHLGDPQGSGGSDYRGYPEQAYFLDESDLSMAATGGLLEVPMTVISQPGGAGVRAARGVLQVLPMGQRVSERLFPQTWWLRPTGRNRGEMLQILELAKGQGRDYVEFMLHSSEFMPGGSPTFGTEASIERLYEDMEALFCAAEGHFVGVTLGEYCLRYCGDAGKVRSEK